MEQTRVAENKVTVRDRDTRQDMTVMCAWCRTVMHRGDPNAPTTHGMCKKCMRDFVQRN